MLREYSIVQNKLTLLAEKDGGEIKASAPVMLFVAPNEIEKKYIIENFKLDEHTLLSSLDPDELARVEQEPDHLAMIFKRPKSYSVEDKFMFRVSSVGVFLFADKVIVVTAEDLPLFDGKLFQKISSFQDLVLKMMYRSVQHFIEHLKVINLISNDLESQINTAMENKNLLNMFALEKSLVYYLSAIQGNAVVIERLRVNANNPSLIGFTTDNIEFLDDLAIENKQCYEQTHIYSDILAQMMDARASVVNNNLNILMKTLTFVMIALMWPPLVCGYLAMNVKLPVDHESLWPFMFSLITGLVPVIMAFIYWLYQTNPRLQRKK